MSLINATAIRMKPGCRNSNSLLEIESIFLVGSGNNCLYRKEIIHDFLVNNPGSITVKGYPNTPLVPATSIYGERYVKSKANNSRLDNLLALPRM